MENPLLVQHYKRLAPTSIVYAPIQQLVLHKMFWFLNQLSHPSRSPRRNTNRRSTSRVMHRAQTNGGSFPALASPFKNTWKKNSFRDSFLLLSNMHKTLQC